MKLNKKEIKTLAIFIAVWGTFFIGSGLVMKSNKKIIKKVNYKLDVKKHTQSHTQAKKIEIVLKDIEITKCEPKPIRIGTINKGGQGDRIYSPLGHAITLSAEGGGAGSKTGAYLINGHVRKLSPRECARVQGFPESFIIAEKNNQAYKQFGNSVALPVLKLIVEKINEAIK